MLLKISPDCMKIGLFGGSFDPVHLGHLLAARAAREETGLDRLFFIPAAQSPFKPDVHPAPASERLRWLRLALAGDTTAELDDQEILRGDQSVKIVNDEVDITGERWNYFHKENIVTIGRNARVVFRGSLPSLLK